MPRKALVMTAFVATFAVLPPIGMQPSVAVSAAVAVPCKEPDCWPAAFAFTPNGREMFYLERYTGEIRRVRLSDGTDRRWGSVNDVAGRGEQGALGIALHPGWHDAARNRWVYVFYTHQSSQENRIVRIKKASGSLRRQTLLTIAPTPNTVNHNGGVIHFGPDGMLYAVTGDRFDESRSQNLADPAGKMLRTNPDGTRPADNPIPGSLAYTFGHRNSFGFTFDPQTGRGWETENGPTCDDEINSLDPGGNYGWGAESACPDTNDSGPEPRHPPAHTYNPVVVPTGAAFCNGCGLGADVEGNLLVGTFGGGTTIRLLTLNASRDGVTSERVLYDHPTGVVAVEARPPDGAIYFSDRTGIHRLTP
ncbi:MAG TPA: PQQ-dependent sugar dehydrogenase [Actinomycetota bacterium]|nr:PQQ-dependent sugar dehydrogenase [Actinomycetota bacterium]